MVVELPCKNIGQVSLLPILLSEEDLIDLYFLRPRYSVFFLVSVDVLLEVFISDVINSCYL